MEPFAMKPTSTRMKKRWWLDANGRPDGPYPTDSITTALHAGRIALTTRICPEGGTEWRPLNAWSEWSVVPLPPHSGPSADAGLRGLAIWHRRFTLGMLAIIVGALFVRTADSTPLTVFALLATTFLQVLLVVGLCRAMTSRATVLWAIVTAVPYLGLIPLLLVSRRATKRLKAAGVAVGLLGAKFPQ